MFRQRFLLLLVIFIYSFCLHSAQQVDFIVAKVGREVILFSDLSKQILQIQNAKVWSDKMTPELILADMVENKMIVQKARELNVRVDERSIKSIAETQLSQVQSQFPTMGDFVRELRAAGLTVSELRKFYEDTFTEQQLKDRLLQTEIRNKINISDSDAYDFFYANRDKIPLQDETYELAMILRIPRVSSETDRLARQKINDIRNKLQRGENFATLAKTYSDCPSAPYGGDLGYFTAGQMVKEFEEEAFKIGINEISGIVKTEFGYHIIMVTDKNQDEVRASHILIQVSETAEDREREQNLMAELYERLQNGEDFAELATEYSQDEESQKNNGVIGVMPKTDYPVWFTEVLSELQVGDISEVLEHQNMYYIFKVNKSFAPRAMEFDEIKDVIRTQLAQVKYMELLETWIEDLRKELFVQVFNDRLP